MPDNAKPTDPDPRSRLTPEQHRVTQQCGTEPPFSGKYWNHKGRGAYHCVVCGQALFSSETKYDSGSGWPSFQAALDDGNIATRTDTSHGMERTEVRCANCDAHLGHIFPDGPPPTGLRYCINSAALVFDGGDES